MKRNEANRVDRRGSRSFLFDDSIFPEIVRVNSHAKRDYRFLFIKRMLRIIQQTPPENHVRLPMDNN